MIDANTIKLLIRPTVIKLLRMFDPRITANGPTMLSDSARDKWLDVIEKHGFSAHLYLPTIGHQDDQELWDALKRLNLSGHIITDHTGSLVGKMAKCRPSSNEVAEQRRAAFTIVETD